jgi:hypothetical protein
MWTLEDSVRKNTGQKKQKCKNCEGKGTLKKGDKIVRRRRCRGGLGSSRNCAWPMGWPRVNIQAVEWNFERLDIPSRKVGRPIKGGLLANQPTCATRS